MPDRLMKFAPLLIVTGILTCLGCLSQTGPGSKAPGTAASPAPVVGSVRGGILLQRLLRCG